MLPNFSMELKWTFLVLVFQCVWAEDQYTVLIMKGDGTGGINEVRLYNHLPKNYVKSLSNTLAEMEKCHTEKPRDCEEIQKLGNKSTGVYTIYPSGSEGFKVRCDMEGGWTVIQRRVSESDFFKTWEEYKAGFGNKSENYWLGNEAIHLLVTQDEYKLRVDLTDDDGATAYAEYDSFSIGDENSKYKLSIGQYNGTAGDSLSLHNGNMFSTKDNDNDIWDGNCAEKHTGAWWYKVCHLSNLNGIYGDDGFGTGPTWYTWKGHNYPLKETEMKVRRV